MRDPMRKRIPRELRRDIGKYIALFLFLTAMIGFISGFIVGDESLKARYDTSFEKFNIEDGHFVLSDEASESMLDKVREADVVIYPLFYKEETISAEGDADGDEVRLFTVRKEVNRADYWDGSEPEKENELAIDRMYAENNGLKIGDELEIGGAEFTVAGITALSDYSSLFRNNSDTMFDAMDFTVATVTDEGFDRVRNRNTRYCYAWKNEREVKTEKERFDQEEKVKDALIDAAIDEVMVNPDLGKLYSSLIKSVDSDYDSLKQGSGGNAGGQDDDDSPLMEGLIEERNSIEDFVGRTANQAINFTGDDMGKDRVMMVTLLYIVIVIMAFIFGITVKSTIEKEAKAIGTLRASGYSRMEMLRHYITIPVLITLAAAIAGNIMGYTFMKNICASMYLHSYSLLPYKTVWSFNAFRDTTVVPLIIIFLVVLLVISRELRLGPLEFLRGEFGREGKKHAVKLEKGSFISRFRKRVLLQNIPSYIVMFFGILFSVIIMLFCLGMWPLLQHYEDIIMESGMAEYQYILKEPAQTTNDSAEKYQVIGLKNADRRAEDITVYGISPDSSYLSGLVLPDKKGDVIISSAYAAKYNLSEGSKFTLKEEYKKNRYVFRVAGIYDYEASLCVFMPIERFNEEFDFDRGDYAGYLSDVRLDDIQQEKVATVITKEDYATITKQLDTSMGDLFELFTIFGVVIFVIVIYLLSKVLIEKNAKSISMVKILGYTDKEISGIYNRVTTLVVFLSMLLCLPIGYIVFAGVFRIMMMFFTGWLTYYIAPSVYIKVMAVGMVSYLFVHMLQLRRIRKVPMGEVLKGME